MSRARWVTLEEAVASISDGASIAPGGFMLGRAPMALTFELVRQGRRDLHVVSLRNPLPAEILVVVVAVSRLDFLFTAISLDGGVRQAGCGYRMLYQRHGGTCRSHPRQDSKGRDRSDHRRQRRRRDADCPARTARGCAGPGRHIE